jgi:group I intron endonuclease
MELSKNLKLSNIILDSPINRYCEIYKIINLVTNKLYIGQTVSHILNHNKYRPHGHQRRFNCHISEAFSQKKNQSHYLNNAIRKYGVNNFICELIEYCNLEDADNKEKHYINYCNSLYPNGYNLKNGGGVFNHSIESKQRLSVGVYNYFKDKKHLRFSNLTIIDNDINKYIKPLNRNNKQYGWYVYINKIKADFGGVHISLNDSYNNALNFIKFLKQEIEIKHLARHLDAGNSLEP